MVLSKELKLRKYLVLAIALAFIQLQMQNSFTIGSQNLQTLKFIIYDCL